MTAKAAVAARVTWPQVHQFRLERHHLLERAPTRDLFKVAGAIGGAQAQVMSAAEMQLVTRVDVRTARVRDALWKDRTLVKTWLERGTLHLIPSSDLPLYAAALRRIGWTPAWLKWMGLNERELDSLVEAIGDALSDRPMTKEELADRVGRGRPRLVRERIGGSWGSMLKPPARRGLLCFGPSRGTNVTFVNPRQWLRSWREIDSDEATLELARRYLRAYGPATKRDYFRWFGPSLRRGRGDPWTDLAKELVTVSVEGTHLQLLAKDLRALTRIEPDPAAVQILPSFDPYLMGHSSRDHLFDKVHRWKVSRVAGWISAVVLVGGRVVGTWTHTITKDALAVSVAPFARLTPRTRTEIGARASALAASLGLARAEVRIRR